MMPIVRKTKKSDFEHAKHFVKEHLETGFPEIPYEKIKKNVERSYKTHFGKKGTFVLVLDNKVIGYLSVGVSKNREIGLNEGELYMIHISKEFRGKGYAHLLMKVADDYFKKEKADYCVIGTHSENQISQSLYKKYGYKQWRVILKRWNK
jgi:ribosomal protein S18 acetylase RimI-like enzyme